MEQFRIDEIARRLLESVPPAFRSMQQDLETNFRAVLRSSLSKLDVVTRDEFDTQTKVLERTRSRLEALEEKVKTLEALAASDVGAPESSGNYPSREARLHFWAFRVETPLPLRSAASLVSPASLCRCCRGCLHVRGENRESRADRAACATRSR